LVTIVTRVDAIKTWPHARAVALYALAIPAYFLAHVWKASPVVKVAKRAEEELFNVASRVTAVPCNQITIVALFQTSANTVATDGLAPSSTTIPIVFNLARVTASVSGQRVEVITLFATAQQTIAANRIEHVFGAIPAFLN
jgi:hypothetical protein